MTHHGATAAFVLAASVFNTAPVVCLLLFAPLATKLLLGGGGLSTLATPYTAAHALTVATVPVTLVLLTHRFADGHLGMNLVHASLAAYSGSVASRCKHPLVTRPRT